MWVVCLCLFCICLFVFLARVLTFCVDCCFDYLFVAGPLRLARRRRIRLFVFAASKLCVFVFVVFVCFECCCLLCSF